MVEGGVASRPVVLASIELGDGASLRPRAASAARRFDASTEDIGGIRRDHAGGAVGEHDDQKQLVRLALKLIAASRSLHNGCVWATIVTSQGSIAKLLQSFAIPVGVGKTVGIRAALFGIDASRHTVIYLGNPTVGARGLYSSIVSTLGGIPRFHRASLIPQAQDALATEEHERGRRVVLVLDEGHLLDADQLEGIRVLTNAEMEKAMPPSPASWSASPHCGAGSASAPSPLSTNESPCATRSPGWTTARRRTTSATTSSWPGVGTSCFSDDALALIHQVSRGLPDEPSTTWPSSPWSQRSPNPRASSTNPATRPPSPR